MTTKAPAKATTKAPAKATGGSSAVPPVALALLMAAYRRSEDFRIPPGFHDEVSDRRGWTWLLRTNDEEAILTREPSVGLLTELRRQVREAQDTMGAHVRQRKITQSYAENHADPEARKKFAAEVKAMDGQIKECEGVIASATKEIDGLLADGRIEIRAPRSLFDLPEVTACLSTNTVASLADGS